MKKLLLILFVLLFPQITLAATISGTVYDLNLNPLNNVVVSVNSTPQQTFVVKQGKYNFELPIGNYELTAKSNTASVTEKISINKEGEFNLDLILVPGLDEEDLDVNIDIEEPFKKTLGMLTYILIGIAIALIGFMFYLRKYKETLKKQPKRIITKIKKIIVKEQPRIISGLSKDENEILEIIKKEGGRTTQKDIRKQHHLSEAKISLIIAELEHKGIVKKIKKGRGNIVILKK